MSGRNKASKHRFKPSSNWSDVPLQVTQVNPKIVATKQKEFAVRHTGTNKIYFLSNLPEFNSFCIVVLQIVAPPDRLHI